MQETQGLTQDATAKREPSTWVMGNALTRETMFGPVVFGRLGRLRPGFDRDTFDWERREFKTAPVEMQTATGYADFLVDVRARAIIYEERPPTISEKQFRTFFKRLYEAHTRNFQNIDVSPVSSTEELYKFVETLDKLTSVSAKVTPSNPEMSRDFESLDSALKKAKAREALIRLSNIDGLAAGDSLVSQAVALAAAGYGDVTIAGVRDLQGVSMKSSKEVVREEIGKHPDDPRTLVGVFHARLRAILEKVVRK